MATGGKTKSTVQYGGAAPVRGLGGGAHTFGSAHSTKGTFVAAPLSRNVVGDRGQALVPVSRVGPVVCYEHVGIIECVLT